MKGLKMELDEIFKNPHLRVGVGDEFFNNPPNPHLIHFTPSFWELYPTLKKDGEESPVKALILDGPASDSDIFHEYFGHTEAEQMSKLCTLPMVVSELKSALVGEKTLLQEKQFNIFYVETHNGDVAVVLVHSFNRGTVPEWNVAIWEFDKYSKWFYGTKVFMRA